MADWLAGMRITADRLNQAEGVWADYSGAWTASTTNPTIGNGSAVYRYMQVGTTVEFLIRIVWGSTTSSGSGTYDFGLPVAPRDHGGGRNISAGATAIVEVTPTGGGTRRRLNLAAFLFATGLVRVSGDGDTSGIGSNASGDIPADYGTGTWAEGDYILLSGRYEVD